LTLTSIPTSLITTTTTIATLTQDQVCENIDRELVQLRTTSTTVATSTSTAVACKG
jgi:hypothetical protein